MRILLCLSLTLLMWHNYAAAQTTISGTVYDITRVNLVEDVKIISTNGQIAATDSLGRYTIRVTPNDTLTFFYKGKPTQAFPVSKILDSRQFDIALHTTVVTKYKALQEVKLYSKTYRQDSIENRETYRSVFAYDKPGIKTGISPGGVAGLDAGEIINIFRFKRNRQLQSFQQRLLTEEQEKYIDYKFSKKNIQRITGLQMPYLETFMKLYRPSYDFLKENNEVAINQYILNCYYEFSKTIGN